jgi:hypothetical protein
MVRIPQRLKTRRFAISLTVVLLLGLTVGSVIGTSKLPFWVKAQDGPPLVTSATSAIRVVALQPTTIGDSRILEVSLQNISSKTIKAYSVGSGKAWLTRSYYFSETAFAPNSIETQIIPLDSTSFKAASRDFTVTAVLFEDGSTDGQAIPGDRLRESWAGLQDYANHFLPCLRQLPAILAAPDETAFTSCEGEAGKWPAKGRSADYEDGLRAAQRESLNKLNEIKTKVRSGNFSDAAKQRDKLVKIFESFQRR